MRSTIATATSLVALLVSLSACKAPTQISVVVTTDVKCVDLKGGISIAIGQGPVDGKAGASTSMTCDDATGNVGTLVISPAGDKNAEVTFNVVAGLGKDVEDCIRPPGHPDTPYGPGCIVARRTLHFSANQDLKVPVRLEAVCAGVPCGATTTCSGGQCVPSSASCDPQGDCAPETKPPPNSAGCGDMRGLQQGAAWPAPGFCSGHVGRSPYAVGQRYNPKWTRGGLKSAFLAPPVLDRDGSVVFVDDAGTLTAVGSLDGRDVWSRATSKPGGAIAIHANGLYIWPAAGEVVFASQGGVDHTIKATSPTSVIVDGSGVVFFGTGDGNLVRADGTQVAATKPLGSAVPFAPAMLPNGDLVVATASGSLFGFHADLSPSFGPVDLKAKPRAMPVVGFDGTIFVGCDDSLIHALAPNGTPRWTGPTPDFGTLACTDAPPVIDSYGNVGISAAPCGMLNNGTLSLSADGNGENLANSSDVANGALTASANAYVLDGGFLHLDAASSGVISPLGWFIVGDKSGALGAWGDD